MLKKLLDQMVKDITTSPTIPLEYKGEILATISTTYYRFIWAIDTIDEEADREKPMNLEGGLNQMKAFGTRYKTTVPPYGRKVKFLNKNGSTYDTEDARKHMKPGQILTVKEIYVGRVSSEVEFVEIPNKKFNTVMFSDVEE